MSIIGTVSHLIGRAVAVKADGSERELALGDQVFADELIRVSPDGALEIAMETGDPVILEGGQSWLATADTYQDSQQFDTSEAVADIESIQAAILAGADPTQVAEETAAGGEGEAEGNEGSSIVQVVANREEVDPTAGFETIGFSDSQEDNIEEEFFDDAPKILGTTTVLLDEDDLVAEGTPVAGFEALRSDFESAIGFAAFAANAQGQDDIAGGDDLPSGALTVLSGNLDVDFGANGDGNITFNDSSTQPSGITSGGADVQYWVSEDGHSIVAYIESEGSAEIIFTAQITDVAAGQFQVALYGALDHTDSTTEDNLILDLSFTIQDSDDDTATGVLRLDIDDDSPIISSGEKQSENSVVDEEGLASAATQDDGYDGDVVGSSLVANGDLNINWGADDNKDGSAADRSVTFSELSGLPELTSNGVEVTYSVNSDGTVLTASAGTSTVFVVTLSDQGSGSYTFELFGNLDHPTANTEDDLNLLFTYTATDADGDSAEAGFTVTVNDDAPVIEEDSSEIAQGNSITLGAPDGSADLADWGVSPGELSGSLTMNGVTATIEFLDNDDKAGSQLRIYNNNANHIGGGGLADNDGQGINAGEVLRISFDQIMQQAEIGVDGMGNHFLPDAPQQAHATWIAYKDGVEVGSGEIDNPEGQNEGLEGLLEVFTISIPGGFDSIELGNNSKNAGSNYEVRYVKAEGKNIIDEEGLAQGNLGDTYADGGDAVGSALTATGDLNINWGADDNNDDASAADRTVTFTNIAELPALTSNGADVKYHLNEEGAVLTAYTGTHPSEAGAVAEYAPVFVVTLSDVDSGSFNFELLNNLDHAEVNTEDNIEFNFEFVAKDSDGDTAEGNFNIVIDDDAPVVGDENQVVLLDDDALDGGNAGGRGDNVDSANTTGTLTHSYGADGEGSVLLLDSNAPAGFTYTLNGDKTVLTISQGNTAVLQVTLSDTTSGDYTVTQLAAIEHADDAGNRENNIQFGVDYQVTDSDGDTANGRVNINVDDDTPVVSRNELIRLDDDALDGGNAGGRGDNVDSANATGTLEHSYGADGEGSVLLLDSNAPAGFTYTLNDDKTVLTISQGDTDVLQVTLSDTTSGDYTVTQLAPIEHADDAGNRENNIQFRVDYQVTDNDGDTANGRVNINVDDDTPTVEASMPTDLSYQLTITNHDYESSAGYNSSYGYYIKDNDGNPTEGHVIWDGVQDAEATTATVTISGYTPDQVGFFIIPNGNNLNPTLEDGTDVSFYFVDGEWQANADGVPLSGAGSHVLFDVAPLNTDGQGHVENNELDGNQNWEDLQIPDGDGDFNDLNVNVEWAAQGHLIVDETQLNTSDSVQSLSIDYSGRFEVSAGADGLESIAYEFTVGSTSGLVDTATDSAVMLRINGDGEVEGYVSADDIVFTVVTDDSGVVTLTQYRAVKHDDPNDDDESVSPATLINGAIILSAVVSDSDGDTASDGIDIGTLMVFEDDGPVAVEDTIDTDEDTSIIIDVLANDIQGADGAEITSFTQPENGEVVLNDNGTFTFTPSVNLHGQETFTYTLTDGDGDTSITTVTVNIEAVADNPSLVVSVGEAVANTSPQTIDISNVTTVDNGFVVTAYDIDGGEASISTVSGTRHDGFGVMGVASGAHTEIGSNEAASERLKVEFGNAVSSIGVSFAWLSGIETATYTFYLEGVAVGSGMTAFQSDKVDGVFVLSPASGAEFDRVDFTAPLDYTDDYLVNSITFEKAESYSYDVDIRASLTDVDGSETLGDVTLSSLPAGVSFDGSKLISELPLTEAQINSITASVKSTETSNSDEAETITNAKVEFTDPSLDATGETADLLIEGTSGADAIIGGDGDDIIFGGAGDDTIAGGSGNDLFILTEADADSGTDTLTDFAFDLVDSSAENDVLDLSDLLSDGSNQLIATEVDGHMQLTIADVSDASDVKQVINLDTVSVSNDADAAVQLDQLLANGNIDDGIS